MTTTHIMIDLETLGTSSTAAIVSIGAAKFDPLGEGIIDSFYVAVDLSSSVQNGSVSGDTLMWWLHPDRTEARADFFNGDQRHRLDLALDAFKEWFGPESMPVWGNGSTFDNAVLRHAYERNALIECPWKFWHDRCYRTLKNLAPHIKLVRTGTHHNAVDDAISQAEHLQRIFQGQLRGCVAA